MGIEKKEVLLKAAMGAGPMVAGWITFAFTSNAVSKGIGVVVIGAGMIVLLMTTMALKKQRKDSAFSVRNVDL